MEVLSRSGNTKRNIIWGFINKFVGLAGPFVVRVLLIANLGADYLGLSTLYLSILQVLSLAELGFASAVTYCMYKPVAEGNTEEVARYLNFFKSVYRWVGIAIFSMGLVVMPFLELFMKSPCPEGVNPQLGFAIYLVNSSVSYLLFAYKQSLLISHQRNDVMNKVNILVLLTQFSLQSLLLVLVPNFYVYAVILPLTTVMTNVLISFTVDRMFPQYKDEALRKVRLSAEERRAIRKKVLGLLTVLVCAVSRNATGSILISSLVGLVALAKYGNYFVIFNGVVGIMGVFTTAMVASVGNSVATESKEKNFHDMRKFMLLYAWLSCVLASCMLALYQPFVVLWVGEDMLLPFVVPLLLTMYLYSLSVGDISTVYVNATGVWWGQRWRALIETIANIVLNAVFISLLGVPGAVLGTLISLLFVSVGYGSHLALRDMFGPGKDRFFFGDHALYALVAALTCAITYGVCSFIPDGGVVLWLAKAVVAVGCSCGLFALAFAWTKRFKEAWSFAKGVFLHRLG